MTEELPKKPAKKRQRRSRTKPKPDPRKWPKLPDFEQSVVINYLAWHKLQAENGYKRAFATFEDSGRQDEFRGMLDYWDNCIKCINWLASRVNTRLEYLNYDPHTPLDQQDP